MAGIKPTPSKSNDWTQLSPFQLSQGGCVIECHLFSSKSWIADHSYIREIVLQVFWIPWIKIILYCCFPFLFRRWARLAVHRMSTVKWLTDWSLPEEAKKRQRKSLICLFSWTCLQLSRSCNTGGIRQGTTVLQWQWATVQRWLSRRRLRLVLAVVIDLTRRCSRGSRGLSTRKQQPVSAQVTWWARTRLSHSKYLLL